MLFTTIGDYKLAAFTFIGGAVAVLCQFILSWFRSRGEAVVNDQAKFRSELWREIGELRGQLSRISDELQETRQSYADLLGKHGALTAEYAVLEREHKALTLKYENIRSELDEMRASQN